MATFDNLKRTVKEATRDARTRGGGTVNVAVRRNIKVASNVGNDGAVERVSSVQSAPIRQTPEPRR